MRTSDDLNLGETIEYYRTRLGLTQRQLGELCGRTESWAWRVENGYPVDSIKQLRTIARVLKLRNLTQLIGNNLLPLADEGPEHGAVAALRRAIHTPTSIQAAHEVDLATVAGDIEEAWGIYNGRTIRYEILAPILPRLLGQSYQVLRSAGDAERAAAARQCISLLHLIQIYLRRIGDLALSELAADRAMMLADEIGDPAGIAASAWNVACVLTSAGHVEESRDLALSTIGRYPIDGDSRPEHVSAYGALHLQAAVASARAGEGPSAWNLLRTAERIASRLPDADDAWHTAFCSTNVAMHAVHLAADEGAHEEALRRADDVVDNPSLPRERSTRYLIEVMNSLRLQDDDHGALFIGQKIMALSPEEIRFHPLVRSTAAHLLRTERPLTRVEVRKFAAHVGVLA